MNINTMDFLTMSNYLKISSTNIKYFVVSNFLFNNGEGGNEINDILMFKSLHFCSIITLEVINYGIVRFI